MTKREEKDLIKKLAKKRRYCLELDILTAAVNKLKEELESEK